MRARRHSTVTVSTGTGNSYVPSHTNIPSEGLSWQAFSMSFPARPGEPDTLKQLLDWISHVGNFIGRHPQLIHRPVALHPQVAVTHADCVSQQRGREQECPPPLHTSCLLFWKRTRTTRIAARKGTDKNIPHKPPTCSPAS